jgi:predicted dehydrogenase
MSERRRISRRRFLGSAAATTAAFTLVPRYVLGGGKFVAPSETINIAIIGCGGQGRTNAQGLFGQNDVRIVAVADPNEQDDYSRFYYGGVAGRAPVKAMVEKQYQQGNPSFKCAEYLDFRQMFDKEKNNIDAVLIATPDHVHAVASMAAIKNGKHVYCEKPLTHNISEARAVAKAAQEAGVATQMGNQGRSDEGNALTCEWVWAGLVGGVREVHAWSGAGGWSNGRGRPAETPAVKQGLDWDLWLGPLKPRPYSPRYCPYNWRGWWPFGTGCIGDMGVHNLEPAFAALKLDHPISVEGSSEFVDSEVIGPNNKVVWEFGQRGDMPPVKVYWCDGRFEPERPKELEERRMMGEGGNGIFLIGDKATIMGGGWSKSPRIIPESKMQSLRDKLPPETIPRSNGHHRNWLDACKGGPAACSNFSYSARLAEFILLGDVAIRAGKKILWDGPNMKAANYPEADEFIRHESHYRPGWSL